MLMLNYLCLYKDSQPDFSILRKRDWVSPEFKGQSLSRSLVKSFKNIQVQIVMSNFSGRRSPSGETYTEVYFHHKDDAGRVRLKGEGSRLDVELVCECLRWLEEELRG